MVSGETFRNADSDLVLDSVSVDRRTTFVNALKDFGDEFVVLLEAGQFTRLRAAGTPIGA